MKTPLFTGVCTALVTPFHQGKIHIPMLKTLLERQISAGIEAVVLSGTTGEAPTLSDEEKLLLFREGKKITGNRCLIIAGTGSNDTSHAITLSQAAEEAGADALLVVSPYYNKATPEGLYQHFSAIADSVHIPLILYNVPTRTGVDIPVEIYRRLSEIPNIAGVKEASADIRKAAQIRAVCPDTFALWSGNDDRTVPVMSLGGAGVISVVSNVVPATMQTMAKAALAGDFPAATGLQFQLLELMDLIFSEVNPIPVKTAMKMLGFDCGSCRMPLTELSPKNTEKLETWFLRHGLTI